MSTHAGNTCLVCGRTFEKKPGDEFDMCPACLKKMGERYAPGAPEAEAKPPRRAGAALWAVLAVSVAVNLLQVPRLRKAAALLWPPAPDAQAPAGNPLDLCTANLWNISSLIQSNRWPPEKELLCPASRQPYRSWIDDKGDLVVACPTPADHGLKSLAVSRKNPAPQAVPRG